MGKNTELVVTSNFDTLSMKNNHFSWKQSKKEKKGKKIKKNKKVHVSLLQDCHMSFIYIGH